jgi:hypothetical protein
MDRTMLSRSLNGGYIEQYDFDMRRNLIAMRVDVLENGALSSYDIRFEQVSRFVFETESRSGGAEDRLELTELRIDAAPEASSSEEWEVTISMWDMTHLTLRCSAITIDGDVLR